MSGNWFKDHHRVLVYLPGSGGEFITALLNGQDMESSSTMTVSYTHLRANETREDSGMRG